MNYEQKLIVGKIVKNIMQAYGRSNVFQNIYKTGTRTVKCYRDPSVEDEMCHAIRSTLSSMKVPYTIRRTHGGRWGASGLIVKF